MDIASATLPHIYPILYTHDTTHYHLNILPIPPQYPPHTLLNRISHHLTIFFHRYS